VRYLGNVVELPEELDPELEDPELEELEPPESAVASDWQYLASFWFADPPSAFSSVAAFWRSCATYLPVGFAASLVRYPASVGSDAWSAEAAAWRSCVRYLGALALELLELDEPFDELEDEEPFEDDEPFEDEPVEDEPLELDDVLEPVEELDPVLEEPGSVPEVFGAGLEEGSVPLLLVVLDVGVVLGLVDDGVDEDAVEPGLVLPVVLAGVDECVAAGVTPLDVRLDLLGEPAPLQPMTSATLETPATSVILPRKFMA
jgi:hypothetical protein